MDAQFAMNHRDVDPESNRVATAILDYAFTLHREVGPGLLERIYRNCLAEDLREGGLRVREEVSAPLVRKGKRYEGAYRLDLLVEDCVVVEVKAGEQLHPAHLAQLRTYLKLTGCQVGLLLNFNSPRLKEGLHRVVVSR